MNKYYDGVFISLSLEITKCINNKNDMINSIMSS
jgi:hypothetical protein